MGAYSTFVVGLDHRTNSELKFAAQLDVGEQLSLVREHNNRHDRNAVLVTFKGVGFGYLKRSIAEWVAERLDDDRYVGAFVQGIATSGLFTKTATQIAITIATSPFDAPESSPDYRDAMLENERRMEFTATLNLVELHRDNVTNCIAILRWLGKSDGDLSEREESVVDDCVYDYFALKGLPTDAAFIHHARLTSYKLKGSKAKALSAIASIAKDDSIVALVSKSIIRLAAADGTVSDAERKTAAIFAQEIRRFRTL